MLKTIRFIWETIRTILSIALILFLAVILTQRFTNNKMSVLGLRVFNVATESMVPEYLVGDAILVRYINPENLKIGDDVTYLGTEESFKDRIVTHRIIDIEKNEAGKYIFQTKGIANENEDPKINETQVYGKVIYKLKSITYLNSVIGNLYGMYFAIIVPFALITFIEYVISKKDDDKEDNEDNEEKNKKDKNDKKDNEDNEDNEDIEKNEKDYKKNGDKDRDNSIDKLKQRKQKLNERRKRRREKRRKRLQKQSKEE